MENHRKYPHQLRTRQEKTKDMMIAKLEHRIMMHQMQSKRNKKIFLYIVLHLLILSICIAVGIVYQQAMIRLTAKPENCVYYSLDLKYDFRAKCEVCVDGYFVPQRQFTCFPNKTT